MPDAATLAVLQDLVYIAFVAAITGGVAYAITRSMMPAAAWNLAGNVVTRCYDWPDAALAAFLALMMTSSITTSEPGTGSSKESAVQTASEAAQISGITSTIVIDLVMVAIVVGFLRIVRNHDPGELFGLRHLRPHKAFVRAVLWMVPTWFLVWGVAEGWNALLEGVWPDLSPQSQVKMLQETQSLPVKVLMSVAAIIVAPLTEEVLFRGLLYGVIKRYTDPYFAGLVSALFFAIVHAHIGSFLPLFALGAVFAAAYEATGCLLVTIFMHAIFNSVQVITMLLGIE